MKSLLCTLSLLAALAPAPAVAGAREAREAEAALDALARKHREAPAFTLSFESRAVGADGRPMSATAGTLTAAAPGRFRLQHAQGTVVSDGATLWQYSPATRQVLIQRAADAGGAGGILLRYLQARVVDAHRRPDGALRVVLDPLSVGENLDSLIVTLSPGDRAVRLVETEDAASNRVEYSLKSLRYDARPAKDAFTFRVPAGAEAVDMR